MIQLLQIIAAPTRGLRRLYNWTIHWAKTRQAPQALFVIAFMEASFFPIPPDVLLIPMVIANQKGWLKIALVCSLGSVIGAVFGYAIGWSLYESIGRPIVDFYQLQDMVALVGQKYSENAFITILTAAFTPIPYKVITIGAGLFKIALPTLVIASIVGRAGRFFLIAILLRFFGQGIANFIEKYFDLLSLLFFALLVGGFFALKYFS